jgi:hypothetical protein
VQQTNEKNSSKRVKNKKSEKYKIYDKDKAYFVTLTVVGWLDVFTRKNHQLAKPL